MTGSTEHVQRVPDWDWPAPSVCRVCGCTAVFACEHPELGTCDWAGPGLCTACVEGADPLWEHAGPSPNRGMA